MVSIMLKMTWAESPSLPWRKSISLCISFTHNNKS